MAINDVAGKGIIYETFFVNFRVIILHFTGWSRHNAATASHIVTSHHSVI